MHWKNLDDRDQDLTTIGHAWFALHNCCHAVLTMEHAKHVKKKPQPANEFNGVNREVSAYSGCSNAVATSMITPRTMVMASAGSTKLLRMPHMCCSLSAVTLRVFKLVLSFCNCGRGSRGSVGALPLINHTET